MPEVDINDLGTVGVVRDTPAYMLPPEAWTLALNMRVVAGGMETLFGWEQTFGTPGTPPHFALPVRTASSTFWLYTGLTKAYAYDGTNHQDITRAVGGDYGTSATEQWNGTLLGGIAVLNNGTNVPQAWLTPTIATKLVDLPNWPSTLRAKVVRAFGPFLIAINITKSANNFPHMVKWSHPADPGAVPISWDETDATKDTGETELSDVNAGILQEALQLGDTMYLYKEASTWKMKYVGGRAVFDLGMAAWLPSIGILAARCVAITNDGLRHVVATQDDIIQHNGSTVKSVLTERQRRRLFNELDSTHYGTSFMFDNPLNSEIWFCYPPQGASYPTKALILNYLRGGDVWPITEADGITFRNATIGPIELASDAIWENQNVSWEDYLSPWSELIRRRVIVCSPDNTKLYNLDRSSTRDGVVFNSTLQREGLSVIGRKRNGDWIVDFEARKLADVLWPKVQGGPISIRLGMQNRPAGPVSWKPPVTFDPAADVKASCGPISGRAIALEFASPNYFRLDGYKINVTPLGNF